MRRCGAFHLLGAVVARPWGLTTGAGVLVVERNWRFSGFVLFEARDACRELCRLGFILFVRESERG